MARFKINAQLVTVLLPVVLPIVKDLAAKTETTVDDRLVDLLVKVSENPALMALLIGILGGDFVPAREEVAGEDAATLYENADLLCALFSVAKAA
jgi:hypothetical protein